MKRILMISLSVALLLATYGVAQQSADKSKQKFDHVGAWSVVSAVIEVDGKTTDLFGPSPQGQFIFTRDGYFSLFVMRSGRPKFASNSIKAGTAEEYKEAMTGLISLVGSYTIQPDGTQTLHIVGSSLPNWDGAVQKRVIQVNGDEMTYTNPFSPTGGGTVTLKLKRAK